MKTNLKNVPSKDGVDAIDWSILMGDWLEAFEKELREIYKYFASDLDEEQSAINPNEDWIRCLKLRMKLVKLILGEI